MNHIKLLIFDLDGVLVDSRKLHYTALNRALAEVDAKYVINEGEHLSKYDGLPTSKKLEMLSAEKGLPHGNYKEIWERKQFYTGVCIEECIKKDERLINILSTLKKDGYTIYCASNSIWNTVKLTLFHLGAIEYFDWFISNEEVKNPKPFPEIYLKCIERSKLSCKEICIFEDSPIGRRAAYASGCYVCPIIDPNDLTLEKIYKTLDTYNQMNVDNNIHDLRWKKKINIIVPMAGHGSRFSNAGYTRPKPLIDVGGGLAQRKPKPMIQLVVENLNIDGFYIFIVQKAHEEKYNVSYTLKKITNDNCQIIYVDGVTEGAACTVLLAKEYINNDVPILIANSDQFLEWDSNEFLYCAEAEGVDGCISTFYNDSNKWSYAKLDENGFVTEVQEKNVISNHATTGIYYWKHGSDYVKYAEQMINKNIRVNNEFYTCPVYNEAIADGKKIKVKDCVKMWGIGVPEDLEYFLNTYNP